MALKFYLRWVVKIQNQCEVMQSSMPHFEQSLCQICPASAVLILCAHVRYSEE